MNNQLVTMAQNAVKDKLIKNSHSSYFWTNMMCNAKVNFRFCMHACSFIYFARWKVHPIKIWYILLNCKMLSTTLRWRWDNVCLNYGMIFIFQIILLYTTLNIFVLIIHMVLILYNCVGHEKFHGQDWVRQKEFFFLHWHNGTARGISLSFAIGHVNFQQQN